MPKVSTFVQGKVPQQFGDEDEAARLQEGVDAAGQATKAILGASLIFNFLFAFALSQIWDTLNSLQIIGYMTYFNVYMPNHVSMFYTLVLDLAEFNFFDVTPYAKMVFPFLEERGDNEEDFIEEKAENTARRLAYTVGNSLEADVENLHEILQILSGLMLISLLIPLVLIFILFFYFSRKLNKSLNKAFNKMWSVLFWNGPIRYFIESYISISVAYVSWFSWKNQWSMPVDYFINIFCIFWLIIYGFSPLFLTLFLRVNFSKLQEKGFRRTFHELIAKLNPRTIQSSNFISVFCYRRLILALLIVFMQQRPFFQIQFQMITIQIVFVTIGMSNALRWKTDKIMEYFNEVCVLICAYHYFLFSDFVPDPVMRSSVGDFLLFFTGLNVSVNLGLIIKLVVQGVVRERKIKRRKNAYFTRLREIKQQNQAKKRQQALLDKALLNESESNLNNTNIVSQSQLEFSDSMTIENDENNELKRKQKKSDAAVQKQLQKRQKQLEQIQQQQNIFMQNYMQMWQQQQWHQYYQAQYLMEQQAKFQEQFLSQKFQAQQNQIAFENILKQQNIKHRNRKTMSTYNPITSQLEVIPEVHQMEEENWDKLVQRAFETNQLLEQNEQKQAIQQNEQLMDHINLNLLPQSSLESTATQEIPFKSKKKEQIRRLRKDPN